MKAARAMASDELVICAAAGERPAAWIRRGIATKALRAFLVRLAKGAANLSGYVVLAARA